MYWLLSSLIFVVFYLTYKAFDILLGGVFFKIVLPYFEWIRPTSILGGFGIFIILGVPLYIVITFLCWLYHRSLIADDIYPTWGAYCDILGSHGRRRGWPLILLTLLGIVVFFSLFGVFVGNLKPAYWALGVMIWWGMLANYISSPVRKKEVGEKEKEEREVIPPSRTISAKNLVERLRKSRIYLGQIVWNQFFEGAKHNFASELPSCLKSNRFLRQALKNLGVDQLYQHQKIFAECIEREENVILATPTGSGRSTICDLVTLFMVLVKSKNILYICPNKDMGEQRHSKFQGILEKAKWQWSVKASRFLDKRKAFKFEDELPEVLFVTPEVLHHCILPNHKDWDFFLSDVDLIVLDDLQFYRSAYGSNCAFLFRRLIRILSLHSAHPRIIGTTFPLSNLRSFVQDLTGQTFKEENLITVDHKGFFGKSVVFWNPPLERQDKGHELKRLDYYEEAKKLFVEVFIHGFDTLLLSKEVLLTERDIKDADGEILKRLRDSAQEKFERGRGQILDWVASEHQEVISSTGDFESILQKTFAEEEEGKIKAESGENKASEKTKQHGELQTARKEEQKELLVQLTKNIAVILEDLVTAIRRSTQEKENSEKVFSNINEVRDRTEKNSESARSILSSEPLFFGQALHEWLQLEETIDEFLTGIREKFKECDAEYQRIMSRIEKTKRWLALRISDIKNKDFSSPKLDACLMMGFPGTEQMVMQEIEHTGGEKANVPSDWFLGIITPQTPLSQYYKNHPEEHFLANPEERYVVNLDNKVILQKHLLCMVYEDDLKEKDAENYLGAAGRGILQNSPLIKRERRTEVVLTGEGIKEIPVDYYVYDKEEAPHTETHLTTVENEVYKIMYSSVAEEKAKEIGVVEHNRIYEKVYEGAIIRVGKDRYRVSRIDEDSQAVYVKLENAQKTTAKINEVKIELASFLVMNENENKEMGRLDEGFINSKVFEGSILAIGKNNYRVQKVDVRNKSLSVEFTVKKDNAVKVDLQRSIEVQKSPEFPFRIGRDRVKVTERILGYTIYNCFDVADKEAILSRSSLPEREFSTQAFFISFPDQEVSVEILHSLAHLLRALMPSVLAYEEDELEVSYQPNHSDLKESAIFIYDNSIDSLGLADTLRIHYDDLFVAKLLESAYQILVDCPCREGCPGCLHIFECRHRDSNAALDKKGVLV